MDEWTIKTPNPICRLFFKIDLLTDFAAFVFNRFYRPSLLTVAPVDDRNFTCVLLPLYLLCDLSPPSQTKCTVYTTVCGCGGGGRWGVLNCAVDRILPEFYTVFPTRFRTYKIASPPQIKMTSKDDIKGLVFLSSFVHGWYLLSHGSRSYSAD